MKDPILNHPDRTAPVSFSAKIKGDTTAQHILLETNPLLAAIVSPHVTLKQYSSYLSLMQNILDFYERNILSLLATEQRKSSTLISADLQHMQHMLPQPVAACPYDIGDTALTIPFAWGFGYVMEGSKLGGRVIFKNIQRRLGFSENAGATFLNDDGLNTFVDWKTWMDKLSGYVAANDCEQETIRGAQYAFKSVYNYFELNRPLYAD